MFISTLLRSRFILIAALAMVLATAAYGFANANTGLVDGNAGSGTSTVSGYTIGNVTYVLATDAQYLDKVTFTLDLADGITPAPSTTTVKLQLVSGTTTWVDATYVATNVWEYDPANTAVTVASINVLNITAHD